MNIIYGLNELFWKLLSLIIIPIKVIRINILHINDEITYKELMQLFCWILLVIMFFGGISLTYVLGPLLFIRSRKTKELIYKATSILLVFSIIWIILPIQKFLPYYLGIVNVTFERMFVSLHPIRVTIALLYYQLACRTHDFRWTKPKDLAKDLEEEEEQIDTYIEEGED